MRRCAFIDHIANNTTTKGHVQVTLITEVRMRNNDADKPIKIDMNKYMMVFLSKYSCAHTHVLVTSLYTALLSLLLFTFPLPLFTALVLLLLLSMVSVCSMLYEKFYYYYFLLCYSLFACFLAFAYLRYCYFCL